MKITLILATVIIGMISCNPGSSGDKTAPATITTPTAPASNSTAPAVTTPTGTNSTVTTSPITTTTANPAPAATSPTTTNSGALNPAHGQPGHRCDIAVGAPLNSSPTDYKKSAGSTPQTITTSPQTVTTSPQTVTPNIPSISTAPIISPSTSVSTTPATGLNPAHGQPGHRCDISVGAPLNSKPVSTTPALPTPTKQ